MLTMGLTACVPQTIPRTLTSLLFPIENAGEPLSPCTGLVFHFTMVWQRYLMSSSPRCEKLATVTLPEILPDWEPTKVTFSPYIGVALPTMLKVSVPFQSIEF